MIRLRKLSLVLGIPAPLDNDSGSKNLFLKLYRKRFFLDCLVEYITNTTPTSLGISNQKYKVSQFKPTHKGTKAI